MGRSEPNGEEGEARAVACEHIGPKNRAIGANVTKCIVTSDSANGAVWRTGSTEAFQLESSYEKEVRRHAEPLQIQAPPLVLARSTGV